MPQFAPLGRLPRTREIIGGEPRESKLACGENTAISGAFEHAEICVFLALSAQRCQCPQRLWKVLHRDDPEPVGIAPGLARVRAGGDEESVHTRLARPERLL